MLCVCVNLKPIAPGYKATPVAHANDEGQVCDGHLRKPVFSPNDQASIWASVEFWDDELNEPADRRETYPDPKEWAGACRAEGMRY